MTTTEKSNLNIRFVPEFGERKISEITTEELRLLRYSLNGKYKPSTNRTAATVIGRVFADAHLRGCRPDNPALAANTDLPKRKVRRYTIYWPRPDEHESIRRCSSTQELVALDLAAEMSIQLPVQQYLKWDRDVDVRRRTVSLHETTSRNGPGSAPLNIPGRARTVADMTTRLAATLLRARALQVLDAKRLGEMPPARVQPTQFRQREFAATMTRLGLRRPDRETRRGAATPDILKDTTVSGTWDKSQWSKYTSSDFCHIAVMRWIKQGLSAKTIATRLGFTTTKPVFAIYGSHLRARSKKVFAKQFELRLAQMLDLSKR